MKIETGQYSIDLSSLLTVRAAIGGLSVILWRLMHTECYVGELRVSVIPLCCCQGAVDLSRVKDIGLLGLTFW